MARGEGLDLPSSHYNLRVIVLCCTAVCSLYSIVHDTRDKIDMHTRSTPLYSERERERESFDYNVFAHCIYTMWCSSKPNNPPRRHTRENRFVLFAEERKKKKKKTLKVETPENTHTYTQKQHKACACA